MVLTHDVDIERGPPPSRMEKVITVLTKIFKVKRYIVMFFIAWVAFAFTCAHKDEITDFMPDTPVPTKISGRPMFRSDRSVLHKKLAELGNDACGYIDRDVNIEGGVMFDPVITEQHGEVRRVKVTEEDGTVSTNERYRCVMVQWTDENFTEYHKKLCDKKAYCIQYLADVIRSHERTEL